jgi:hypothetical protein
VQMVAKRGSECVCKWLHDISEGNGVEEQLAGVSLSLKEFLQNCIIILQKANLFKNRLTDVVQ